MKSSQSREPVQEASLYRSYQNELAGERMARSLRTGIVVVIGVNTLFVALDYFAYPERFWLLACVRMALNVAVGVIYWRLPAANPLTMTRVGCMTTGIGLIAVSGAAGGITSDYVYALPVLLLGMPVLLPLNVRQSSQIVVPLLLGLAGLPLVTEWEFVFRDYAIGLFFPLASGVECVASCSVLDRLRFLDFRQRRELEQAEAQIVQAERLAAIGELAAGVAHEANNPVNYAINAARALAGCLFDLNQVSEQLSQLEWTDRERLAEQLAELERLQDELGGGDFAETATELVGIVTDGLQRTAKLVGELRDFAKPGGGRRVPLDLREGLESTLKLVAKTLVEHDVDIDLQVPDEVPVVEGDSGALNQVFLNLIKNAAEAMEDEGGVVNVRLFEDAGALCVVVRDDGPGIAPEVQDRLFEPFFTTKGAGEGSGLGLSICRQIAQAHGGSLTAESTFGQGATFTLRLPIAARRGGV